MTEHLDPQTLSAFRSHRLAGDAVLSAAAHIGACRQCAAAAGRGAGELVEALAFDDADHLPEETVVALADGSASASVARAAEEHLAGCATCSTEVADLRRFHDAAVLPLSRQAGEERARRGVRAHRGAWYGLAAAAVIVGIIASTTLRQEPATSTPARTPATTVAESAPVAAPTPRPTQPARMRLRDGNAAVVLYVDGSVAGVPREHADLVRRALTTGALPESRILPDLLPVASVLRGTTSDARLAVLQPVGSAVLDNTPPFQWTPVDNASAYRVTILTEDLQPVTESPSLNTTSWTPDEQLPRGKTLTWQVAAQTPEGEIVAPGIAGAEAKFHVVSSDAAREVTEATRSNSHLLRGLVYAQHGLLLDAEAELEKVAAANPNSDVAKKLLADVRARLPRR